MPVINVQSQTMFDPELAELSLLSANTLRALRMVPSTKIQSTIEEEKSLVEDNTDNQQLLIAISSLGCPSPSDNTSGDTQEITQPRNIAATSLKRKSTYRSISQKGNRISFMDWIRKKLHLFGKTKKDSK